MRGPPVRFVLALASVILFYAMIYGGSAHAAVEAPANLTAKAVSPSQISLSWAPPSSSGNTVSGYEVERSLGGLSYGTFSNSTGALFFSVGNATSFTDSGLQPATTYNYAVFAILSSPPSNPAAAGTPGTAPGAPTGLAAMADTFSKIKVTWTPPAGNGGSPITGYEVERAKGDLSYGAFSNSTNVTFLAYGNSTSFVDSGLQPNTTYNYTAFAINSLGSGPPAGPSYATTPQEVSITVASDSVTGSPLGGIKVLEESKGAVINSGLTPATFHMTYGRQYSLVVQNDGIYAFDHWDNGLTNQTRLVTATSNMTITAFYAKMNLQPFYMMALLKTGSAAYPEDSQLFFQNMVPGDYLLVHGTLAEFPTTLTNVQQARAAVRPGVNVMATAMFDKVADIASQVPAWPKGLDLVFYDYENGTNFSPEFSGNETASIGYFDQAENAVKQYNANTGGSAKLLVAPSFSELRKYNWDWGLAASHMDMIDVQFGGYTELPSLFQYAPPVFLQIRQESPATTPFIELSLMPNRGTPAYVSNDTYVLDGDGVDGLLPWYSETNVTQSAVLQQFLDMLPRTVAPPPANLTATAVSSSQVTLGWNSVSNGTYDVSGYKVERTAGTGAPWSAISWDTGSNATSYTDSGLAPGVAYTYRVSAINSMGTGSPSGNATALTPGEIATPSAPTGLVAKATTFSKIKLGWNPPSGNGGSPITGYEIERARGDLSFGSFSNSTYSLFFSFGNATTFSDSGLVPNTNYNYTVFAENRAGAGPPSVPSNATTPKEVYMTVQSDNSTGGKITGMPIVLDSTKGVLINSGHTTVTFHTTEGAQYDVVAENYGSYTFSHWDNGLTNQTRPVTATSNMTLTAFYN